MSLSHEPLEEIAAALGIDHGTLVGRERPDLLLLDAEVLARDIAAVGDDTVRRLTDALGAAVTLHVRYNGLEEFTIEGGAADTEALERLRARAQGRDDVYDVSLRVDKTVLVQSLGIASAAAHTRLFFYRSAVERELRRAPRLIEEQLWPDSGARLIVLVLDSDMLVERAALTVLGGTQAGSLAEIAAQPVPADLGRLAARRDDYISWDTGLRTVLTPSHFASTGVDSGDPGDIPRLLDGLVVALAAMYLCDRAREKSAPAGLTQARADFRGRDHVALVPIDWGQPPPEATPANAAAAVRLVEWCYQTAAERPATDLLADRLPFVQTCVAQLLEGRPEVERFAALSAAMPSLVESCRWNWQSFIEGRIGVYLDQVAGLESSVGDAVNALAERTSALSGKVTETALAEVAALVGAFIAAAFQTPFQSRLFSIAMIAYAAYVLIFPLGIGLSSLVGSSAQTVNAFTPQKRNVEEVLGADRVEHLVAGRVAAAQQRFRFWAWVSGFCYVAAAAASIVAAFVIPGIVKHG